MGAPAEQFWALDDLIETITGQVVRDQRQVIDVIDDLAPILLRPEDRWPVIREGVRSLVHEQGVRPYRRSGKTQSSTVRRVQPEELEEVARDATTMIVLERLVFETADGEHMRSVLEFKHEDAVAAYNRRVVGPRAQANREEPFWQELMKVTEKGWTLARRKDDVKRRLAKLAIAAQLTNDE